MTPTRPMSYDTNRSPDLSLESAARSGGAPVAVRPLPARERREHAVLAIVHDADRVAEICEQISAYFAFQHQVNPRGFDCHLAAVWVTDDRQSELSIAELFAARSELQPRPLVEVCGVWSLLPLGVRAASGARWSHAGVLRQITQSVRGVGAHGHLLPVFRTGGRCVGIADQLAGLRREFGSEILGEPMLQDRSSGALADLSLSGL